MNKKIYIGTETKGVFRRKEINRDQTLMACDSTPH